MAENGKPRQYKLKEVCIRLAEGHPLYSDKPLSSPEAALDVMKREMSQYDREILCVVNMDSRLRPINFNIVSVGTIDQSIAAIPNILKSGILSNAGSFLLLHNHPSGEVTPSQDDIQTTLKVIEAERSWGSRAWTTSWSAAETGTTAACGRRSLQTSAIKPFP